MITVKAVGLDEANKTLKRVWGYATAIEGVQKLSGTREDGGLTNAEVMQHLADGGRDFRAPDDALNKAIAAVMAAELQQQINRRNQNVDSAAASVYKAAIQEYARIVEERIANGDWQGGGGDLSPDYAIQKNARFGFTHPIGVATGQMRRAVNVAGKIKLIKAAGGAGLKLPSLPKAV